MFWIGFKSFFRIVFHAVDGGRWLVKWRLEGDEMETMRGTDRSIGPRKPSPQMSTLYFYIFQNCLQIWKWNWNNMRNISEPNPMASHRQNCCSNKRTQWKLCFLSIDGTFWLIQLQNWNGLFTSFYFLHILCSNTLVRLFCLILGSTHHHLTEFVKVHGARAILVQLVNDPVQLLLGERLQQLRDQPPQGVHSDEPFPIFVVDSGK